MVKGISTAQAWALIQYFLAEGGTCAAERLFPTSQFFSSDMQVASQDNRKLTLLLWKVRQSIFRKQGVFL